MPAHPQTPRALDTPQTGPALDAAVAAAQLNQVYGRMRASALLSMGVALAFSGVMLPLFGRGPALTWLALLLCVQSARLVLWWLHSRQPREAAQGHRWRGRFTLAAAASGAAWAFGPCMLLPGGEPMAAAVLAVTLLAVSAVAVVQISAHWPALVAFIGCALLPTAAALLAHGGHLTHILAAIVAMACVMLLITGRSSHRSNEAHVRAELGLSQALQSTRSLAAELQLASQQREHERRRLAQLLAATHAASAEWNLASGRVFLNERGFAMLGRESPPQRDGVPVSELACLIHTDDLPEAHRQVEQHLAGQRAHFEFEVRLRHTQGYWVWTRASGQSTATEDGTVISGTFIDIGEAKAKERRWRSRAELSADWFWESDPEHRVTLLSDGIRDGLPIPHSRVLGRRLAEVAELHPADGGWSALATRLGNQEMFNGFVCQLRADDGAVSFIELDGRPRLSDSGRFIGYEGVGRDITARRRATEALKESLALVDTLVDTMAVPVVLKDTAGRYVRMNKAYQEFIRSPGGQPAVTHVNDLLDLDAAALHGAVDAELLRTPGRRSYEVRQRLNHGPIVDMLVHKATLLGANGEITGLVATMVDITEQKRAAAAMAQAVQAAEQANRAKSSFLATMSHELRTPLNAVIGAAQLLRGSRHDEEVRNGLIETIEASGAALLGLIENVMDLSRIEAGALALHPEDFNLLECAEAAVATAAVAACAKGLTIACIVAPDVPLWRRGDLLRLRQVLLNLLGNAVKFTPAGEVVLHLQRGSSEDILHIAVRDTGIGVASEALGCIFEPFRQADAGTNRRFGGSGLGLAIVRQLVVAMGGQISVTSELGRGTCFEIQMPLDPAAKPPAPVPGLGLAVAYYEPHEASASALAALLQHMGCEALRLHHADALAAFARANGERTWLLLAADAEGSDDIADAAADCIDAARVIGISARPTHTEEVLRESAGLRRHLARPLLRAKLASALVPRRVAADEDRAPTAPLPGNRRVLVVEDDAINRHIVSTMLTHAGYAVGTAVDGQQALRRLAEHDWDLVLMDWQMPDLDGLEVTRRLRAGAAGPRGQQVSIVALTANAFAEDRNACLAAGMNDFLTKPVHAASLLATVAHWCQRAAPAALHTTADTGAANEAAPLDPSSPQAAPACFDATVLDTLPMVADGSAPEYAAQLLHGYVERTRDRLRELLQAQRQGDAARWQRGVHTLKSASAAVGAAQLAALAARLEAAARAGGAASAGDHQQLEQAFAALLAELQPRLARLAQADQTVPA